MKYYTLKQVSEMLIIPIPYLRKLINEHKLKGVFIGRQFVSEEDLNIFINSLGVKNEK